MSSISSNLPVPVSAVHPAAERRALPVLREDDHAVIPAATWRAVRPVGEHSAVAAPVPGADSRQDRLGDGTARPSRPETDEKRDPRALATGEMAGSVVSPGLVATSYAAQSLFQEHLGAGLHIEPWDRAITAYRQVQAGPKPAPRLDLLIK